MQDIEFWKDCDLLEAVPGRVSGAPVFKNTRLPVSAVVENVDAFMEIDGQSLDEAIEFTLECFDVPRGANGIRAVLPIVRRTNINFSLESIAR